MGRFGFRFALVITVVVLVVTAVWGLLLKRLLLLAANVACLCFSFCT